MFRKLALCVVSLALALALPMGAAFAAPSDSGNAPELKMAADTTAANASNANASKATAAAKNADQSDPAKAPATSPATGAMLIAIAGGTVALAGGAGAAAARLRK